MTAAAFTATYAEWRVIKTRAAVQIVFELPVEKADEAYQALGGMPIAAREVWCAIARLAGSSAVERDAVNVDVAGSTPARSATPSPPSPTVSRNTAGEAERRKFEELLPAQQAGILCNEVPFWSFLQMEHRSVWRRCDSDGMRGADIAAAVVRELCRVNTRANLTNENTEWLSLVLAYRCWQAAPRHGAA